MNSQCEQGSRSTVTTGEFGLNVKVMESKEDSCKSRVMVARVEVLKVGHGYVRR